MEEDGTSRTNKYKFLRRTVTLSERDKLTLRKIKLKQVHLKEIRDQEFDKNPKYYLKAKGVKCLSHLKLEHGTKHDNLGLVKNLKALKKFTLQMTYMKSIETIIPCMKRLNKNIVDINLQGPGQKTNTSLTQDLYRRLASFPKLRTFGKRLKLLDGPDENIQKDYDRINRYLTRLRHLSEFNLDQEATKHDDVQAFRPDQVSRTVTGLAFILSEDIFKDYRGARHTFKEEQSDDGEEQSKENQKQTERYNVRNAEIIEEAQAENSLQSKVASLFKFDGLPNLRKLRILLYKGFICPLTPPITEGFKSLKKLEHFHLTVQTRPLGTVSLFKGLCHLPLLKSFRLEMCFIKNDEIRLLTEFFLKQTQLVSITLDLFDFRPRKTRYHTHNLFIQNIAQGLENKPYLRYLALKSDYCILESFSKGLKQIKELQNLEEFEIKSFGDFLPSSVPASERIQGLCDFLKRHKHSLRRLTITLNLIVDDDIIDGILESLSELTELRALYLNVNTYTERNASELVGVGEFFNKNFAQDIAGWLTKTYPNLQQTYNLLDKALNNLSKLNILSIQMKLLPWTLENIDPSNLDPSKIFETLSTLKDLETLSLCLPILENMKRYPKQMKLLKRLIRLRLLKLRGSEDGISTGLEKIVEQTNQASLIRSDLMF